MVSDFRALAALLLPLLLEFSRNWKTPASTSHLSHWTLISRKVRVTALSHQFLPRAPFSRSYCHSDPVQASKSPSISPLTILRLRDRKKHIWLRCSWLCRLQAEISASLSRLHTGPATSRRLFPQLSWPLQGQEDTTTNKDKISFYLYSYSKGGSLNLQDNSWAVCTTYFLFPWNGIKYRLRLQSIH